MNKQAVIRLLSQNEVQPVRRNNSIYAWLDGPTHPLSPVEFEWIIEFHFNDNDELIDVSLEKHLIGP